MRVALYFVALFCATAAFASHQHQLALREAARSGLSDRIRAAIEQGADVHFNDNEALHIAVSHRNIFVIEELIERGADVNSRHGTTFGMAVYGGYVETVKRMLLRGANPSLRSNAAARIAIVNDHVEILALLLPYITTGVNDLLALAVASGSVSAVSVLLCNDTIDVNYGNGLVLRLAVQTALGGVVKLLLDFGATVEAAGGRKLIDSARKIDRRIHGMLLHSTELPPFREQIESSRLALQSQPLPLAKLKLIPEQWQDFVGLLSLLPPLPALLQSIYGPAKMQPQQTRVHRLLQSLAECDTVAAEYLDPKRDLIATIPVEDRVTLGKAVMQKRCWDVVFWLRDRQVRFTGMDALVIFASMVPLTPTRQLARARHTGYNLHVGSDAVFHRALELGDAQAVEYLLRVGFAQTVDLNQHLLAAIRSGHGRIVAALVGFGADIAALPLLSPHELDVFYGSIYFRIRGDSVQSTTALVSSFEQCDNGAASYLLQHTAAVVTGVPKYVLLAMLENPLCTPLIATLIQRQIPHPALIDLMAGQAVMHANTDTFTALASQHASELDWTFLLRLAIRHGLYVSIEMVLGAPQVTQDAKDIGLADAVRSRDGVMVDLLLTGGAEVTLDVRLAACEVNDYGIFRLLSIAADACTDPDDDDAEFQNLLNALI